MTDADSERRAVVAWLRALADTVDEQAKSATWISRDARMLCAESYRATADLIEAGEHLKLLNPETHNG